MYFRKLPTYLHFHERLSKSFTAIFGLIALLLPLSAAAQAQQAPLGRYVVIGDSLSAGFQNGTLVACQQVNGYANLIAKQAGVTDFALPLITPPGLPPLGEGVPFRVDPTQQAHDLAVPGQTINQALTMVPLYTDPAFPGVSVASPAPGVQALTNFLLGFPGPQPMSQVGWANALAPDTLIVWLGSNDAIGVAEGLQPQITSPIDFARNFEQLMQAVTASNRKVIVATVPDATLAPAFQAAPPLSKLQLRAYIIAYNAAIALIAPRYGATIVDIFSYLNRLALTGTNVGGVHLTTKANGGIFSIDGLHPTNTGYALIANQFIDTINQRLRMHIPDVDVAAVAAADPLFPPNVGKVANCIPLPPLP